MNGNDISWPFDQITVIRFSGYYADRGPALGAELRRVGLWGKAYNHWVVPSPFFARFCDSLPVSRAVNGPNVVSELLQGMYGAVKLALDRGAASLLVLEDDIRFLRNLDLLNEIIHGIPEGFWTARLSWIADPKNAAAVSEARRIFGDGVATCTRAWRGL